jgi:hypothetical protein
MPAYYSTLKQYTAPTCSLDILARSSTRTTWFGRPEFTKLHFQLRLMQSSAHDARTLEGDLDQLQALHTAVEAYVQKNLGVSSHALPTLFQGEASEPAQLSSSYSFDPTALGFEQSSSRINVSLPPLEGSNSDEIRLRPINSTSHTLSLGSLATQDLPSSLDLTTLQLHDLLTTLDAYSAERPSLLNLDQRMGFRTSRAWLPAAAAITIGAVGLGAVVTQVLDRTADTVASSSKSNSDQPVDPGTMSTLPPIPALPNSTPTEPGAIALPSPNANAPQIPTAPLPPPPLAAIPPLPDVATSPDTLPASPSLSQLPASKSGSSAQSPKLVPSEPLPSTSKIGISDAPDLFSDTEPSSSAQPSSPSPSVQLLTPPGGAAPTASKPKSTLGETPPSATTASEPPARQLGDRPTELPTLAATTPKATSSQSETLPDDQEILVNQPTQGSMASNAAPNSAEVAPTSSVPPNTVKPNSGPDTTQTVATGTAFDVIQQVSEVRSYFEQRWTPPKGLNQVLEYHLLLGNNGSLQQISPLGEAAGQYLDRTNMPLVGERFVSPVSGGKNAKIRLVLGPDGKVMAFLESKN